MVGSTWITLFCTRPILGTSPGFFGPGWPHRPGWPHYSAWSDLLPATPLCTPPPTYITDLTPSPVHWTLGRHPTHGTCCSQELSCFTDFHSPGFCKTFFGSRWETSDLLLRPQYCYRLIQTFRTPPPFLFNEDRQNSGTPTIKYSILCMTSTKKPPYYSPLYHRATFLSNSWVCTQLVFIISRENRLKNLCQSAESWENFLKLATSTQFDKTPPNVWPSVWSFTEWTFLHQILPVDGSFCWLRFGLRTVRHIRNV